MTKRDIEEQLLDTAKSVEQSKYDSSYYWYNFGAYVEIKLIYENYYKVNKKIIEIAEKLVNSNKGLLE